MTQDLTGRRFGKLTITGPAGPEHGPLPPASTGWRVGECICGHQVVGPGEGFLSRRLESCGRPTAVDRAAEVEWLAARQSPPRF